jgi:hypothetical protein
VFTGSQESRLWLSPPWATRAFGIATKGGDLHFLDSAIPARAGPDAIAVRLTVLQGLVAPENHAVAYRCGDGFIMSIA